MDTNARSFRGVVQLLVPVILLILSTGCGDAENGTPATTDTLTTNPVAVAADTAQTIQDILQEQSRFSQLATAIDSAGLSQTLSGPGPFTVFAPTDDALQGVQGYRQLLSPEQRDRLRGLLLYHVSSGERTTEDLQAGTTIRTLEGSDLTVSGSGDSLQVGGAGIVERNIPAANGIIHVIDEVLAPTGTTEGV